MMGMTVAVTSYASGGAKKTAESCSDDSECNKGLCYTKRDSTKVCVDCSPSDINEYRRQIDRYCKQEPRACTDIPRTDETPESYFQVRIDSGDRCVSARQNENSRCWDGADSGHKQAAEEAEKSRKNCHDELNTRKGNGGIYTCSDSTYADRSTAADASCKDYGKGCDAWSKDDKVVSCNEIEDAMKKTSKCVEAVERLDSDCIPRMSNRRDAQFRDGKKAYDSCKEVLDYKKDKKLCKK